MKSSTRRALGIFITSSGLFLLGLGCEQSSPETGTASEGQASNKAPEQVQVEILVKDKRETVKKSVEEAPAMPSAPSAQPRQGMMNPWGQAGAGGQPSFAGAGGQSGFGGAGGQPGFGGAGGQPGFGGAGGQPGFGGAGGPAFGGGPSVPGLAGPAGAPIGPGPYGVIEPGVGAIPLPYSPFIVEDVVGFEDDEEFFDNGDDDRGNDRGDDRGNNHRRNRRNSVSRDNGTHANRDGHGSQNHRNHDRNGNNHH